MVAGPPGAGVHGRRTPGRRSSGLCKHTGAGDQESVSILHLIELFLPLYDNDGSAFPKALYASVRTELADLHGGVTAITRAPATGLWEDGDGEVRRDEVVLFEVMVANVDHAWWRNYRQALEQRFRQDHVLVRATAVERL